MTIDDYRKLFRESIGENHPRMLAALDAFREEFPDMRLKCIYCPLAQTLPNAVVVIV